MFSVSPSANVRWNITSRLTMSVYGGYNVSPVDFNRFFGSLIMQDYMTFNKGYYGYEVEKSKTFRYSILYHNAIKGTHINASISRTFSDRPYTMTQESVGDYFVWGLSAKATKGDIWQSTLRLQQGIQWLNGKLSLQGLYTHNNTKMVQNEHLVNTQYNMLNTTGSFVVSPIKDMTVRYLLRFSYNDMKSEYSTRTSFCNWLHEMSVVVPVNRFRVTVDGEYYHNKVAKGKYKDIFMGNGSLVYQMTHINLELKVSNLLNNKSYSYSTVANMMTMQSITALRGREIMLSLIYKP